MLKAVLFDMDGVLVDSESEYMRIEMALAQQNGFELTAEEQSRYIGSASLEMWMDLQRKYGFSNDPHDIARAEAKMMNAYYAHGVLRPFEPALRLLKSCADSGLKVGVATSALHEQVQHVVNRLGLEPYAHAVVSSSLVDRSKPAPDIYLMALRLLGVAGSECVVIEDADSGVQAAREAGVRAIIGIRATGRYQSLADADLVVPSLETVTLDTLRQMV